MNHSYEIEIKSLLGSKEKADELTAKMRAKDPNLKILASHKQLNHYFVGGSLNSLYNKVQSLLDDSSRIKLKDLSERAIDFSVRTREADSKVILVVKASVDDTTSENGTARLEWESVLFPSPIHGEGLREGLIKSMDELDELVLSSGFAYQAKWSRERSAYDYNIGLPSSKDGEGSGERLMTVAIDKNAGYGYLAEFEMIVDDKSKAEDVKSLIRAVMGDLGVDELPQDRLQRMFDFYNKNWQDYYGTDKVFTIE